MRKDKHHMLVIYEVFSFIGSIFVGINLYVQYRLYGMVDAFWSNLWLAVFVWLNMVSCLAYGIYQKYSSAKYF